MKILIDNAMLKNDVLIVTRRHAAIRKTVHKPGVGRVLVSKRTKSYLQRRAARVEARAAKRRGEAYKSRKVVHGMVIANYFVTRGTDAFDFDLVVQRVGALVVKGVLAAFLKAWKTKTSHQEDVHKILKAAAEFLEIYAKVRIKRGNLGQNAPKYAETKKRLAEKKVLTKKYGVPAPYGIATGQFMEGIKHDHQPKGR